MHAILINKYQIVCLFLLISLTSACSKPISDQSKLKEKSPKAIIIGNQKTETYLPFLKNKKVGLLVNHTSYLGMTHLVDTLISSGIDVMKIFAPEHGYRGVADAGEKVVDGIDSKTGLPVISLYGSNKKPTSSQLEGIDVLVFDIQDVGVRFYTYISSMHLAMEACAEAGVEFMVLDRPNPLKDIVDGPIRTSADSSFVGMHPIPIIHGQTIGELAQMINGEKWINGKVHLTVIPCSNYNHEMPWSLKIKPSPNLPNDQSIALYPSLCLFEGTAMSIGRGTSFPFQVYGYPDKSMGDFVFRPKSIDGMSKNPKHKDQDCYGTDLRSIDTPSGLNLNFIVEAYKQFEKKDQFFTNYFHLLAGNQLLEEQIKGGLTETEIKATWKADLAQYLVLKKKYQLYP